MSERLRYWFHGYCRSCGERHDRATAVVYGPPTWFERWGGVVLAGTVNLIALVAILAMTTGVVEIAAAFMGISK